MTAPLNPSPSDPPRTKLFADPSAEVVWAAVQALDEAAKHQLLQELGGHLAVPEERSTPTAQREARAVAALREALAMHQAAGGGASLSVNEFRALRHQHPECGWPPDGSIRRWLGGNWNQALKRAGLNAVPDEDVTLLSRGPALTLEEVVAAIRMCSEDLSGVVPSSSEYRGWVRRPDVLRRPGRRPMSQGPFDRLWPDHGWTGGLQAAGLIDQHGCAQHSGQVVRTSAHRYQLEDLLEQVRACADELGRSPRTGEYDSRRQRLLASDPRRPVPSRSVASTYGISDWDDVLELAGRERLGGRATSSNPCPAAERKRRERDWTDQQLLEFVREGHQAKGEPFTSSAYKTWRKEEMEQARVASRQPGASSLPRRVPSYDVLWQHFGSFKQAKQLALLGPERGDQP